MAERTCSVTDCEKRTKGHGLCSAHLNRLHRYGSPTGQPVRPEPLPCSVVGCASVLKACGLCDTHYRRWRRHGDPNISLLNREHDGTCTVEGCRRPYRSKGLCDLHAQRVQANGQTARARDLRLGERFWAQVIEDERGCWIWSGARDKDGYGTLNWRPLPQPVRAHRWSYEAMVAAIPAGLELDHLCRIPACVNPYHLDPVPGVVNIARAFEARRQMC